MKILFILSIMVNLSTLECFGKPTELYYYEVDVYREVNGQYKKVGTCRRYDWKCAKKLKFDMLMPRYDTFSKNHAHTFGSTIDSASTLIHTIKQK